MCHGVFGLLEVGEWVEACCSVLCVRTGQTALLCAAVCCNALKWVASKFRYINIYDNRYVNRNRCVYKDKCIWDIGEWAKYTVRASKHHCRQTFIVAQTLVGGRRAAP